MIFRNVHCHLLPTAGLAEQTATYNEYLTVTSGVSMR